MTKKRFMQIAEEVGIASSDWKEDLWEKLPSLESLDPKEQENVVTRALGFAFVYSKQSLSVVLRRATRD